MRWTNFRRLTPFMGLVGLGAMAGCSGPGPDEGTGGGGSSGLADPFAAQPDTAEGLTNTDADLEAVLEKGALAGACEAYWSGDPEDRKAMLLCGKAMFFYEAYGTVGVPSILPEMLLADFEDIVGPGFEKLGMVKDPYSDKGLPLGMAKGAPFGNLESLAFTCASCHFARLPDGRYSVGAPNHGYEYGQQTLMMAMFPVIVLLGNEEDHDPDAVTVIQPLLDKVNADPELKSALVDKLLPLATAGGMTPIFPKEAEHHYAMWRSGTMDFLIEPLFINDTVHTISKISALWGIPGDTEVKSTGMLHAMLGVTGGTPSLSRFAEGFVTFGGGKGADWPAEKLRPLVEYVESLRAPQNPSPPAAALVDKGEIQFVEQGCLTCHGGPRGSGKQLYEYEEIGTDTAMKYWLDPDLSGETCCDAPANPDEKPTHKLKSPRLAGLWTMQRFLHNGSVDTLESLLCKDGPRGTVTEPAYGDAGHDFGCDLSAEQKDSLAAYLLSH